MRHSILLIITGSIAAYKALDLIRRLREQDIEVRCVLTKGGEQFITPLSVAALSGNPVYEDLFSLKDESEMGHIRLSRETDMIVVAPASADFIAKMAGGFADDLATTVVLASNKPLLVAPAMNTQMWQHPATQRNVGKIVKDGASIIEPGAGMLACGETGAGRMAEVDAIVSAISKSLGHPSAAAKSLSKEVISYTLPDGEGKLQGVRALVTSGPTHEAIDLVRFLGNRSSGKQGQAIATALARQGAEVILVTGPTSLTDPPGVHVVHVTSAAEMHAACEKTLPVDVAVCAAAVSDWRAASPANRKLKKRANQPAPSLALVENIDILKTIATHAKKRPELVIGFAAETEQVLKNATDKRKRKGCDWILANDVSGNKGFGATDNKVTLITPQGKERWPLMTKEAIAEKLVDRIAGTLFPPRKQEKPARPSVSSKEKRRKRR